MAQISKKSSEMWKRLPPNERAHWDIVAERDKLRYESERAGFNGAWKVPNKRTKKDKTAPKRPMSAFLFYSQDKREGIKATNPGIKNTEISRILGDKWRNAPISERTPYLNREKRERSIYMRNMEKWRMKKEKHKKFCVKNILHETYDSITREYDDHCSEHRSPRSDKGSNVEDDVEVDAIFGISSSSSLSVLTEFPFSNSSEQKNIFDCDITNYGEEAKQIASFDYETHEKEPSSTPIDGESQRAVDLFYSRYGQQGRLGNNTDGNGQDEKQRASRGSTGSRQEANESAADSSFTSSGEESVTPKRDKSQNAHAYPQYFSPRSMPYYPYPYYYPPHIYGHPMHYPPTYYPIWPHSHERTTTNYGPIPRQHPWNVFDSEACDPKSHDSIDGKSEV